MHLGAVRVDHQAPNPTAQLLGLSVPISVQRNVEGRPAAVTWWVDDVLTDERGRVLARSRDSERYIGKFSGAHPVAPRDVPRTQRLMGLDGVERFYGNAPIDRGPWLLSVGIPTSVAMTRITPLWRRDFGIAALGLTAFLVVSLVFAHLFSRDLNRLRQGVQRIADGDLSPPVKGPVPNLELRQLQDAFITMAANLRNAHAALDRQIEQERKMREVLQSLQRQVRPRSSICATSSPRSSSCGAGASTTPASRSTSRR